MEVYDFYVSSKDCKLATKDCLRGSWKTIALTTLVYFLFYLFVLSMVIFPSIFLYWWLSIPLSIFAIILLSIFNYGYKYCCLKLARQDDSTIGDLFSGFSKRAKDIIKVALKKFFLSLIWLVLLVVPVVIKNLGYSMSTYLLIDRTDINADNALKTSQHIMKQNYGRYFKFLFSYFWWFCLIVITAGVAGIWVLPKIEVGKALFYENLKTDF